MLTPVQFVLIIVISIILLSFLPVVLSSNIRLFVRKNGASIVAAMIVVFLCAFPYKQQFFLGQEYEDAYVFTEYSRYLLYNQVFTVDPLQTKGCVLGSLNNCLMEGTYGGHLLVLSSISYFISKYAGYTPSVICMINLLVSLASIFLVYCASHVLSGDRRTSMACSLLYAITPAMSLFHTSGLSDGKF